MLSRASQRTWWMVCAVAVLLTPVVPGPSVTVRAERALYRGPDLLSQEAEVTATVSEDDVIPGLVVWRTLRTTQGGTLLREVRRLDVAVPWLLLLVGLGWVVGRVQGRGRSRAGHGALLVLCLTSAAGASCGPGDDPAATLAETRIVELLEMRRTGNVARAAEVFDPVAVYEDYPNQVEYRGLPEIAEYLVGTHQWAGGVFLDVTRVHAAEDWAVAEWVLAGEQNAPFPGVADSATYRSFRLEGVTVVELERGMVVRAADYADMMPLVLGLGGSVTLPSGEVIRGDEPRDGGS